MASHSVGGMELEAEPDFEEEFELLARDWVQAPTRSVLTV